MSINMSTGERVDVSPSWSALKFELVMSNVNPMFLLELIIAAIKVLLERIHRYSRDFLVQFSSLFGL